MTIKLYDQDSHQQTFSAQVLSCTPREDGRWDVLLDQTAFFPEGGGQQADRGHLSADPAAPVQVLDVQEGPEGIVHICAAPLPQGAQVQGDLDWPLRFGRMQCHSGEHVISGLAHRLFGCNNVGFHMGEDAVILDFDKELSPEDLQTLESAANQVIWENRPVTARYPAPAELEALDYRSKLALTENVRIVTIEGCDVCACCAPHVAFTGEIGLVKLIDAMRHRGGMRLWMVAGALALADYRGKQANVSAISAALSVKQSDTAQGVSRLKQELQDTGFSLKEARQALMLEKCRTLPETPGDLCLFEADLDSQSMRALVNAGTQRCGGLCAVFSGADGSGYRYVIGSKSMDLRPKAKALHQALGGKGGGQAAMIQGSVPASRAEIAAYFS